MILDKIYNLLISFFFGALLSGVTVYKVYSWKVASVEIKEERGRYDVLLKEYQEYIKETEKNFSLYSTQLNQLNNKKIELEKKQEELIEEKNNEINEVRKNINGIRKSFSSERMDSDLLSSEHRRLLARLTEIANGVPKTTTIITPDKYLRDAN